MSDADEDLAERVAELEAAVEDLREEVGPPRGPMGVPRPPSPGDVLRFTDEYAIPAAIAILEANVRVLELLQRVLRAGRTAESPSAARERAADLGRESLARLDRALEDLSEAMEEGNLPREPESRRLLEDVRELNRQVREELGEEGRDGGDRDIDADDDADDDVDVDVDVEAELESIKDEVRDEEDDASGGSSEEGGEGEA